MNIVKMMLTLYLPLANKKMLHLATSWPNKEVVRWNGAAPEVVTNLLLVKLKMPVGNRATFVQVMPYSCSRKAY